MSASSGASACPSTWLVGPRWCRGATCPEGEAEAGGKGAASETVVPMPPPGCRRGQGRASAEFGGLRSTVQAAEGKGSCWGQGGDGRGQEAAGKGSGHPAKTACCPAARGRAFLGAGLCACPTRSRSVPTSNPFPVAVSWALSNRM
uniref:Uncharacterized protein n=1 Tax=Rousettus aegyptiacus TaxID=9407 RepID=A0A7J8CHX9_ROUAE|nr:hypothetical protein HJG63_008946 [Rousettus aegyptiacus]